jgi:hypothetical protein
LEWRKAMDNPVIKHASLMKIVTQTQIYFFEYREAKIKPALRVWFV